MPRENDVKTGANPARLMAKERDTVHLELPPMLGVLEADRVIALIRCADETPSSRIEVIGSRTRFADPAGLCMLSCAGKRWRKAGREIAFSRFSDSLMSYLERMDVLQHCGVQDGPARPRADASHKLLEVTCVAVPAAVDDVAIRLARAVLGEVPSIQPDVEVDGMHVRSEAGNLTHCIAHVLTELMDNSLSHGRRLGYTAAEVWVCCQYVPKRDALRIAVIDDGCGLLNSLGGHPKMREKPSHERAICVAFEPGMSCNKAVGLAGVESSNLGMGLTICHELALAAGGAMWVGTGDLWMRDPRHPPTRYTVATSGWQGVIAATELKRSQLKDLRVRDIVAKYRPSRELPQLRFGGTARQRQP